MWSYTIHVGDDATLGDRARAVRRQVFIEEQGVDESLEVDGKDADATHLLLTDGDTPIGTARLRYPDPATVKIERVAVLESYRSEGLGRQLMERAEAHAREAGATTARLHSQEPVVPFYERLGYEPVGEPFEEAGIPHRAMVKTLDGG